MQYYSPCGVEIAFVAGDGETIKAPLVNGTASNITFNGHAPALSVGLTAYDNPVETSLVTSVVKCNGSPLVIGGSVLTLVVGSKSYYGTAPTGTGITIA